MPGLLRTPSYARAALRAGAPRWVPAIVEERVQGRMAKQQILFPEHPPHFEAVVDESVLHRIVGSPAIMRAQLMRLLDLSDLPSAVSTNVHRLDAHTEQGICPAEVCGHRTSVTLRVIPPMRVRCRRGTTRSSS
jgi:Domain of unknown function (DUF5753)